MEIVASYVGKLPHYCVESMHQLRTYFQGPITFILDDLNSPYIRDMQRFNVTIVPYEKDEDFHRTIQENISKICIAEKLGERKLLFIRSFERFFILERYMKQKNTQNVLFLELDLLLYFDPNTLLEKFSERSLTMCYVDKERTCSALSYVKSVSVLSALNTYFLDYIRDAPASKQVSEMEAITSWLKDESNRADTWMLPIIWPMKGAPPDSWLEWKTFGETLFDGAGIAINIDGPDNCHREEWERRGRVWWACDIDYAKIPWIEKNIDGKRSFYLIQSDTIERKVACLHVHNKNITRFLSLPLEEEKEIDLLSGDHFLKDCDIVLRKKEKEYYEVLGWNKKTLLFFEDIPFGYRNPAKIFCQTDDVVHLEKILDRFTHPFILVSHNSDENIREKEKYTTLLSSPFLKHWFSQNMSLIHPKTSYLPIGIANPVWEHGTRRYFQLTEESNPVKMNPVYANFLIETNREKREHCFRCMQTLGIPVKPKTHPQHFLFELASSFFSICPEGNGVDTHRFWESLYLGVTPICLRNAFTERLAKKYPVVLLDDWLELTVEKLVYGKCEKETMTFAFWKTKINSLL